MAFFVGLTILIAVVITIKIMVSALERQNRKHTTENLPRRIEQLKQKLQKKDNAITELRDKINDLQSGIVVTGEFQQVADLIKKRKQLIFVHGGAGTGKSTLIQWLREKNLIGVVIAPTGLAALNVQGMTIHKFFHFPPVDLLLKGEKPAPLPQKTQNVLQVARTICIDEISMVKADVIDAIDKTLRNFSRCGEIFGGYQIVFVGDLFQLPPIVKKDIRHFFSPSHPNHPFGQGWESEWFLDADAFINQEILKVNLTHVFRQKNAGIFAKALNQIRCYQNLNANIDLFNRNIAVDKTPPDNSVIIVGKNVKADMHNENKIRRLPGQSTEFNAIRTGIFESLKEKDLPTKLKIELKIGTFVMLLYNDIDGQFVNGSTGSVRNLTREMVEVRLKNGNIVQIQSYTWKSYEVVWDRDKQCFENKLNGTFTQMPLIPAYAITCHKAQGKTLDNIYIDVERTFTAGQTYVALSRVREIEDITLKEPLSVGNIKINGRLREFLNTGRI